jgi:hypothetical protein
MQDMVFVLSLIVSILVLLGYGSLLDHVSESTKLPWVILFGWLMFPVLVLVALWICASLIRCWRWLWGFRRAADQGADRVGDPVLAYPFPRSVIERFQNKYPSLSQKECELVVDGLKLFFSAQVASGGELFSMPSRIADALWREFILHTREYEFFCRGVGFHMDRVFKHTSTDKQKISDGLQRCWSHVCTAENLDSQKPAREPLLFSLDSRLNIAEGLRYRPDENTLQSSEDEFSVDTDTVYQLEMNSSAVVDEDKKALLSRDRIVRSYIFPVDAIENFKLKYPLMSSRECDLVIAALKQFFLINLISDNGPIAMPSMAVNTLWREFILHTKSYRLFCEAIFGSFMHYTPVVVCDEFGRDFAGLEQCWLFACKEEGINPREPVRLPLLFALDARLKIPDGICYEPGCSDPRKQYRDGKTIYCIKGWIAAG